MGAVMATTITAGASVITPLLVEGFEAARSGGAIVHTILGRANPDVTLRPAGTRTGALELLFADEAKANQAWSALAVAGVFTLASDERAIGMTFVIPEGERIGLKLDDTTRNHWHVTVPYREVTA
ncbi:hypothetical protein [Microbacterium xylanilyticum]